VNAFGLAQLAEQDILAEKSSVTAAYKSLLVLNW